MTTLLQHAKAEMRAAGMYDDDADFEGQIAPCVEGMLGSLVAYGHTGTRREEWIGVTLGVFDKIARHMPLTPLTGEDDEWEKTGTDQMMINKRCYQVFKDDDMAWDVRKGRVAITFPYTP